MSYFPEDPEERRLLKAGAAAYHNCSKKWVHRILQIEKPDYERVQMYIQKGRDLEK